MELSVSPELRPLVSERNVSGVTGNPLVTFVPISTWMFFAPLLPFVDTYTTSRTESPASESATLVPSMVLCCRVSEYVLAFTPTVYPPKSTTIPSITA